MTTAQIIEINGQQAICLPEGFRFASGGAVSIRKDGQAVVLEQIKPKTWPPNFFEDISIEDPAFARPPQGHFQPGSFSTIK